MDRSGSKIKEQQISVSQTKNVRLGRKTEGIPTTHQLEIQQESNGADAPNQAGVKWCGYTKSSRSEMDPGIFYS